MQQAKAELDEYKAQWWTKRPLLAVYEAQQTMPEAALDICLFVLTLIEYSREHAFELARIKKQAFAGRAEIELGSIDNYCLEMASIAARALAVAFAKFQIDNGIEHFLDTGRIFARSQQAV